MFADAVKTLTKSVFPILGMRTDGKNPPWCIDCQCVGTGFFISDFGTCLTAHHVVEAAVRSGLVHSYDGKTWLGVMTNDGTDEEGVLLNPRFYWALPVCEEKDADFCILQIIDQVKTTPAEFCERRALTGDAIGALGFPLASYRPGQLRTFLRFFGGYVCSVGDRQLLADGRECFVYETDIMFLPGISGAPVVSHDGKLLGLVHGTHTLKDALVTLSLVVSANEVAKTITESLLGDARKAITSCHKPSHPTGPKA